MSRYHQQLNCTPAEIDLDFWRNPRGVAVPDDELSFLLVPDAVESLAIAELASQVHAYQSAPGSGGPITTALMATMGGMLPGILLYDHLVHGRSQDAPRIVFGTVGVSLYKGPDERHDAPQVHQEPTVEVKGETVLLIDDLGDRGNTLAFLQQELRALGAEQVLSLVVYMKPAAQARCPVEFHFGEVAQDCWIITPRELVETMVKRVPVWRERGASDAECRRRLVELIGYPAALVDHYLGRT